MKNSRIDRLEHKLIRYQKEIDKLFLSKKKITISDIEVANKIVYLKKSFGLGERELRMLDRLLGYRVMPKNKKEVRNKKVNL